MKPRVVIQDIDTGEYRRGNYSWTPDLQYARMWRSDGVAKNARLYSAKPRNIRYVPVRVTVITDGL